MQIGNEKLDAKQYLTRLCDPDSAEARAADSSDRSYKRGATQGVCFAYDWLARGGSLEDLARLCDLSMEMRNSGKGSAAFLDELLATFRRERPRRLSRR